MSKFADELDERSRARAAVLRRLAGVEMMLGNRHAALTAAASAFRLDPLGVMPRAPHEPRTYREDTPTLPTKAFRAC